MSAETVPTVVVSDLTVRYGSTDHVAAVDHLDLVARAGEVLVVLGPNGAGKTSTIEVLEGYRRPSDGHVRVLGLDPVADHRQLAESMGVMLQRGGIYPMLGPRRVLDLFSQYYPQPLATEALLDVVELRGVATTPWRHLSGGEQQRLSLALALVGRPRVVFLDEPTAGVDPEGRLAIRSVVADLRSQGVSVLLTTHELSEAEKMADRIVILVAGRVVLEGTPTELTAATSTTALGFGVPPVGLDTSSLAAAVGAGAVVTEHEPGRYRIVGASGPTTTAALATWLAERNVTLTDLVTGRSFEEAYLEAVGAARQPGPLDSSTNERRSRGSKGPAMNALWAQTRTEVFMTLRRGETLLLTVGIPVVFLLFFSTVHVVSTPHETAVDFFVPGILALAVMSTAMVSLGIATGFERGYGVLKRLGATPLGRPRLLGAKIATMGVVEVVQAAVLVAVGFALGWNPDARGSGIASLAAIGAVLLSTAAFGGIGLFMAGVLKAEVNLAAANGLYLVLLLLGGMVVPITKLPGWVASIAKVLPPEALSAALHAALGAGSAVPTMSWVVLAVWAVAAPGAAALSFRWE